MMQRVWFLVHKDFLLEWRKPHQSLSLALYLMATVYVIYLVFESIITPSAWNALFWISLLFGAMTTAGRSFQHESGARFFFYYALCSPRLIILSKMISNAILLILLAVFNWFLFSLFLGNPMANNWLFLSLCLFGGIGLSAVLTLISGIAAKVNNHPALLAVLGLPLLLPLLMLLITLSSRALVGADWQDIQFFFWALIVISLAPAVLSYILYPLLWRD